MKMKTVSMCLLLVFFATMSASVVPAKTKPREYNAIVQHLKTKYRAKKVNLFFMWAARAIVGIAKPAGVKSFSLTVFRDLKFARETVDSEMQAAMRNSYGPEWTEIVHVRSREGQQAYLYMHDGGGENVKVVLVTLDKENAAIIRATFSPDKVAEFINDPKILGIRLNDDRPPADMEEKRATAETNVIDK
jgi:hypothetical protein